MRQYVERCKRDDEARRAIAEALFQHHAPALFAFLRQQNTSREDAEDILLEVFTAVLEHHHLNRLSSDQQTALIWRIARNKSIDTYRRKQRRPSSSTEQVQEHLFADEAQAPEETLLRLEECTQLHALLQTLSPLQQEVLHLRFVKEMRSPQIASLLGKSDSAVRAILSRTLNHLRVLYREEEK